MVWRTTRATRGQTCVSRTVPGSKLAGGWGFRKVIWPLRSSDETAKPGENAGPYWRSPRLARLEAVLFVGREPLAGRKIAQLASLADGTEVRTLIRQLNRLYDAAGCAFRVEEVAGGYRLMTRPMFGPWLRRAFQTPVETRLSAPAMETLAVVAYRQPILRAEIESIRGVQCGDILRQLMDRDLIRIIGRSEDLGRPLVYGTTKRFLEVFGLRHLDELPRAEHFRATQSAVSSEPQTDSPPNNDPGAGRVNDHSTTVHSPEEESVTTRIRPAKFKEDFLEEAALAMADGPSSPYSLAVVESERASADDDDDDFEDEDDEDWDDDEEEDEDDDDFVDDEWEEVDDDDEEEDEEEDDEEWEDDEDDDDWDDDDDEDDDWDDDDE